MYAQEQSEPVVVDRSRLADFVPTVIIEHVSLEDSSVARHDPKRLVHALFQHEALFFEYLGLLPSYSTETGCLSLLLNYPKHNR